MGDNTMFFKGKRILVTGVGSGKTAGLVGTRKKLHFTTLNLSLEQFSNFDFFFTFCHPFARVPNVDLKNYMDTCLFNGTEVL